jgi:hypothetical protein
MTTDTAVMATLFVQGRQLQYWRLVGNTISIKIYRRAEQLFPMSRLRRVIFIERAPGDMRALWKLLEMGVGVTFMGAHGRLIGAFNAPAVDTSILPLLAERLMHERVLRHWFSEWQENQQRHLTQELNLQEAQQSRYLCELTHEARDWLQGLTTALINSVASEFGLDSAQRPSRCLLNSLEVLVLPWVMMQGRWWLRHTRDMDAQRCCRAFDDFSEPLEDHMRRMLLQLELRADTWL